MRSLRKIYIGNELVAIFLPALMEVDKVKFVTDKKNPIQVGIHQGQQGDSAAVHYHQLARKLNINSTQELLYLIKGKIKVSIGPKKDRMMKTIVMNDNDGILLFDCRHGVEFLDNSRILEVKQGPTDAVLQIKDNNSE